VSDWTSTPVFHLHKLDRHLNHYSLARHHDCRDDPLDFFDHGVATCISVTLLCYTIQVLP